MRPKRFTDINPERKTVLWKDPATFSGWDKGELVVRDQAALAAEFKIAYEKLVGQPAGTKLYPYDYEPIDHPTESGEIIRLTYSFIVIEEKRSQGKKEKKVYVINYEDNDALIDEFSPLGRTIPGEHWTFAKAKLVSRPSFSKMPSHRKVYNELGIKHAFMVVVKNVNGQLVPGETMIVAKATHGWKVGEGSFSTHQVALSKREDETFNFLDIKTLNKYKYTSAYDSAFIQSEVDISVMNDLFLGVAKTPDKNRFLMKLYQTDFFTYVVSCEKKLKAITDKEEILKTYKVFAEILLQSALQLETLHAKNVLHRDIKPENILLILNDHLVRITDFGLSAVLKSGENGYRDRCIGTLTYMAPEIRPNARDADSMVIYTRQSDIFAFSKMFEIISNYFQGNNISNDMFMLGYIGTQEDPKMRPHLVYFQLTLICSLVKSVSQEANFSAFSEKYQFPIKTMLFAETLLKFFYRSKTNTHYPFFDNTWVKVFAQLEHIYACADQSTQENISITLLDWKTKLVALPNENLIFTLQKSKPYEVFFEAIKNYFESADEPQKERILKEAIEQKQEMTSSVLNIGLFSVGATATGEGAAAAHATGQASAPVAGQ